MKNNALPRAEIGERIQTARRQSGYTQEQLAEFINVSTQYVSDLERGKTGMSLTTLALICKHLMVSSDYILFGENKDPNFSFLVDMLRPLPDHQLQMFQQYASLFFDLLQEEAPLPAKEAGTDAGADTQAAGE